MAAPPKGCSSTSTSIGSASSTRTACAATSGPIPSPGSTAIRLVTVELLPREREDEVDELGDAVVGERPFVAALQARDHGVLAGPVSEGHARGAFVVVKLADGLEPPVDRRHERPVDRVDRLAGLRHRLVRHAVTPSSSRRASASGSISTTAPAASASFGVFSPVPVTS